MSSTVSLLLAVRLIGWAWEDRVGEADVRSGGVSGYAADFGYVFESARVGRLDDELLAEGLEALCGDGCHAGVFEGVE